MDITSYFLFSFLFISSSCQSMDLVRVFMHEFMISNINCFVLPSFGFVYRNLQYELIFSQPERMNVFCKLNDEKKKIHKTQFQSPQFERFVSNHANSKNLTKNDQNFEFNQWQFIANDKPSIHTYFTSCHRSLVRSLYLLPLCFSNKINVHRTPCIQHRHSIHCVSMHRRCIIHDLRIHIFRSLSVYYIYVQTQNILQSLLNHKVQNIYTYSKLGTPKERISAAFDYSIVDFTNPSLVQLRQMHTAHTHFTWMMHKRSGQQIQRNKLLYTSKKKNEMRRYEITNANNNSTTNEDIPMKIQRKLCYSNGSTIDV